VTITDKVAEKKYDDGKGIRDATYSFCLIFDNVGGFSR
jgi:hypothetical protein